MKIVILTVISAFLLLNFPADSSAMGNRENMKTYKAELQQVFVESVDRLYENEIDAIQVKNKLAILRSKYDISYTDEAGILDAIIDRAAEGSFTDDESHFYFRLLQEGRLMEYRKETVRVKSKLHRREVLSLLIQNIESSEPEKPNADNLLAILNNYYNFVGLEYDSEYFELSDLIVSLNKDGVDIEEITTDLKSMNTKLTMQINTEKDQAETGNSAQNQNTSQSPQQNSTAVKTEGEPSSNSRPDEPGASSQKQPGSGSGSRN